MKAYRPLILSLIFSISAIACGGDSGPKNLFELDFENDTELQAQIDRNEITGYWETTDRGYYHARMKIEDDKITFAGKCIQEDVEIVAEESGEISLDRDLQRLKVASTIRKTSSDNGYSCWFSLPAGSRSYEMTELGLEVQGFVGAFGLFVKLGELENK